MTVTHNEALRLLDGLSKLAVLDRDLTASFRYSRRWRHLLPRLKAHTNDDKFVDVRTWTKSGSNNTPLELKHKDRADRDLEPALAGWVAKTAEPGAPEPRLSDEHRGPVDRLREVSVATITASLAPALHNGGPRKDLRTLSEQSASDLPRACAVRKHSLCDSLQKKGL